MKVQNTSYRDDQVTEEAELLDIESGLLLHQVQRKEPLDATSDILNILQEYLAQPTLSATQMISKLQKLDKTYYKYLINELAYKHDPKEVAKLINLFEELGYLTTLMGDYDIEPY